MWAYGWVINRYLALQQIVHTFKMRNQFSSLKFQPLKIFFVFLPSSWTNIHAVFAWVNVIWSFNLRCRISRMRKLISRLLKINDWKQFKGWLTPRWSLPPLRVNKINEMEFYLRDLAFFVSLLFITIMQFSSLNWQLQLLTVESIERKTYKRALK